MTLNRLSLVAIFIFSLTALAAVASGYLQPLQPDEGTAAHIFQISVALLVPAGLAFLATANWERPLRIVRSLALPTTVLAVALGALFYLEHYR